MTAPQPSAGRPAEDASTAERPAQDTTSAERPAEDATSAERPAEDATSSGRPAQDATSAAPGTARPTAADGDHRSPVAVALARLAGVQELPLHEQPDVYQAAHTELQHALAAIDDA